jgi:lipopolysaccharide export system permease protein
MTVRSASPVFVYKFSTFHYDRRAVRIITRYIIREIAIPFALGLAVFTLLLLIARILRLVELVVNRGVPFVEVVKVFSYILPAFLEVTVPMALLLAVLVALGRLSSDREVVALKAAGVSLTRIAWPVAVFAGVTYVVALSLSLYARPWGNRLLRTGLYEIAKQRAAAGIKPKVFNDDFAGLVIYVDDIEPPGNSLNGVLISDTRGTRGVPEATTGQKSTIIATAGMLVTDESKRALTLQLRNGSVHSFDRADRSYHRTDFRTYEITLDVDAALAAATRERDPSEMSLAELRGPATSGSPDLFARQVELQRRFAIPFACLAFAAVAVPLGLRPSNSVRSRGFMLSLALILLYYLALTLGQSLAERGLTPTIPAVWLPNVLLVALAGVLLRRTAAETARERAPSSGAWRALLTERLANLRRYTRTRF